MCYSTVSPLISCYAHVPYSFRSTPSSPFSYYKHMNQPPPPTLLSHPFLPCTRVLSLFSRRFFTLLLLSTRVIFRTTLIPVLTGTSSSVMEAVTYQCESHKGKQERQCTQCMVRVQGQAGLKAADDNRRTIFQKKLLYLYVSECRSENV